MPSERKPRILVGSSKEGLPLAHAFKDLLEPDIEVQLWNDAFFAPGEFTLESLEIRSRSFDGALVVGTADDRVTSRGAEFDSVRDNLLFEFGMFVAMFGRRKAILALEGLGETKIPSDLFGLTCVGFSRTDPANEGVEAACLEVKRVVSAFSLDVIEQDFGLRLEGVLRAFLGDLQGALGAPPQLGFHVWVVDQRVEPPMLVRVARSRTSPKAPLGKEFAEGEGIVGECWRTAAPVYVDFSEEPYRTINESSWIDFGPGARKGMSYELLTRSRERYRVVGATPLISDLSTGARVLGCLSYNVGPNVSAFDLDPHLIAVENVLDKAAEVVRIILESHI